MKKPYSTNDNLLVQLERAEAILQRLELKLKRAKVALELEKLDRRLRTLSKLCGDQA